MVAITGRLVGGIESDARQRPGWEAWAVEVARQEPADPGAVVVPLALPPALARVASEELCGGLRVAVVGTLDIDASRTPDAIVLVQSIELLERAR